MTLCVINLFMKIPYLFIALISTITLAQSTQERIEKTFEESFLNKDLECFYYQAKENGLISPTSSTAFANKALSRDFTLEIDNQKIDLSFKLYSQNSQNMYELKLDNNLVYQGELGSKDFASLMEFGDGGFFLRNLAYRSGDQALYNKYDLGRIKCNLEFAKSRPIILSGAHHINVHPHTRYDYLGLLEEPVNEYFKTMDSYVLIDAANRQGAYVDFASFLSTGNYSTPYEVFQTLMKIPSDIPMVISPAGYNDYVFEDKKDIEITFTGGNHNYCIWNNTRNLMWGLFYSDKESNLTINYDTNATVIQRSGIIPGTSFRRKHVRGSNVIADIFKKYPEIQQGYHSAYNYYFQKDFILRFTGLYKTLTYSYEAQGFKKEEIIQGKGTRNLVIKLKYL